jgi:hypothetical protein
MYETITVVEAQAHLAEPITGLTDIDLQILPSTCRENFPGHTLSSGLCFRQPIVSECALPTFLGDRHLLRD